MVRKVVLAVVCLVFLLFIALPPVSTLASSGTRLYVDPPTITASVCSTFTINVSIADVVDLYGYEFKLYYNTTILDALNVTLPPGHFFEQEGKWLFIPHLEIVDNYNVTHGYVWAAVHCEPPAAAPSGSGVLVAITFKCTGAGESILDLHDTKLADSTSSPIPHDAYDGYVTVELLGDVNYDGTVDISDVVLAAVAFGSKPGHPRWNPDADLNGDAIIDIFDLVIIGTNYGKTG